MWNNNSHLADIISGVTAADPVAQCQPSLYHMLANCCSRNYSPWILYQDWRWKTTV